MPLSFTTLCGVPSRDRQKNCRNAYFVSEGAYSGATVGATVDAQGQADYCGHYPLALSRQAPTLFELRHTER